MMLTVYNYIKQNRAKSVGYFKALITLLFTSVSVWELLQGRSSYSYVFYSVAAVSIVSTLYWHVKTAQATFNKKMASIHLSIDAFLYSVILFPLVYANPLSPFLFITIITGLRFLLPVKSGFKLSVWALAIIMVSSLLLTLSGFMVEAATNFSLHFFPALVVNFVSSFSLSVVSNLQKKQKKLEREYRSLNQDFTGLKREHFLNTQLVTSLNKDVLRKNNEIKNILSLSGQINVSGDSRKAIEPFLYTVIGQLGARHALILAQTNRSNNYYSSYCSKGVHGLDEKRARIYLDSNLLNTLNSSREPMLEKNIPKDDLYSDEIKFLNQFKNDLFCPILIKGQTAGILIVGQKISETAFSVEDVNLIKIMANQAAFVMEQTQITSEFQDIYFKTIKAMMKSLEAKYIFARGHTTRTANYVNIVGNKIGLNPSELKELTYGTLLHDVGKIAIRDKYLLNTNIFSEDQVIVKKKILEHTSRGAEILKSSGFDDNIVDLALYHHEDFNGKGYPHGIGEKEIPLGVRILSVCNTYDAMTSDRPHRKALSHDTAKEYLTYNSNVKFDPAVVKAFLDELSANKEMQKFH